MLRELIVAANWWTDCRARLWPEPDVTTSGKLLNLEESEGSGEILTVPWLGSGKDAGSSSGESNTGAGSSDPCMTGSGRWISFTRSLAKT
jgi:hypothetical protein